MARLKTASGVLALSTAFGALAYLIELTGVSHFLPFPPLNYLLYDPAEIVIYFLYLVAGLKPALFSTLLVVLGLSINIDSFSVLIMSYTGIPFFGPVMKGLAIASTLLGLALLRRRGWGLSLASGTASRVILMTFPNILFIFYIVPKLPFPQATIEWFVSNAVYILTLTAVYNTSQTVVAYLPARLIHQRLLPILRQKLKPVKTSKQR